MQKPDHWLKRQFEAVMGVIVALPAIPSAIIDHYAIPHRQARDPVHQRKRVSETAIGVVCLCLIILVAVIDYRSVPRVSFSLFYLLIAASAAWSGSRKAGILIALAGSLAAFVSEVNHNLPPGVLYWNVGVQTGISLFVVLLLSALRNLTEHLEQRVKERTFALEREVTDRTQTEEQLLKTMQQLRQLAENITDAFWIRDPQETRMVYVSPAYEKIWGRSCKELYQTPHAWLEAVHPEDRETVAQAMFTNQVTGDYNQEYRIVRPDGALRWIRDRAFPIRDSAGKVIRIVGIAEDTTDRHRLEREILEISDREQARIGQDLHDGLCQQLVSLGFDNNSLEQQLAAHARPEVAAVRKMGKLLDDAIAEARALSRGLFPVQLEADGLSLALRQLAAGVSARTRLHCRVDCPQPVLVRDNTVATHLYRIAQEAVNNAVKHSRAGSIMIELKTSQNRVELKVSDDGIGIPVSRPPAGGMGLHIMNYRAQAIGGVLNIEPAARHGTVVSCSAPQPAA
ncbi:MAG TPA: PAS domain-containing protein [Candidatus Sulfopaludibacter sp.]|nr:PAS domain-containing protein [Candidatus Sulfopaludibacter sp.]